VRGDGRGPVASLQPEVHLFEPSGYAGVFQHTCRVAQLLSRAGIRVLVHTGHEHENISGGDPVALCGCSWWPRQQSGLRRSQLITRRFCSRTLPHLQAVTSRRSIVHLQGIAATGALNLATLLTTRSGHRRTVYSPHDSFSRRGQLDGAILRLAVRAADAVVSYSQSDVEALRAEGIAAHYSPLVQVVPYPHEDRRIRWREEWGAGPRDDVVLFAGWIRPEKRLDVLIESARRWPPRRRLAVVGQDRGGWETCARFARSCGVDMAARIEFVELEEFTAAISAADVLVAPHERASQSGVLSLARQLGVPAVAADVGGLRELASTTFPPGDIEALNRALDAELARGRPKPGALDEEQALRAHLHAYGLAEAQ
jgi:glycosyltransferase involved in cell wall biosynthesis